MRNLITKLVLALSIGCLGLASAAHAQGKTGGVLPPTKGFETGMTGLTDLRGGAVNIEALRGMLVGMGYEPTVRKSGSADVLHLVIRNGTWTYNFDVSVSGNGRKVWLSSYFNPFRREVNASEFAALLDANFKHGPAHFTYNPTNRQLNLGMAIDNRGIDASVLRTEIDAFTNTIRQTVNLWDLR